MHKTKIIEILWTGGFDSTYRIVHLSRMHKRILFDKTHQDLDTHLSQPELKDFSLSTANLPKKSNGHD